MFFFKHSLISLLSLCLPIFWQHYWPLSLPKPPLTDCLATTTVTSANTTFIYPHRLTKIDFPKEKELRKVCPLCCAVCLPVIFFSFYCFLFYHKRLVGFPSPPTSISLPPKATYLLVHFFWPRGVCVFVIVVEPSSSEPSSSSVPKDPESVRKARPGGGGRNS